MPYCFSRSSIKFQGHAGQRKTIFTRIECFWTVTTVWLHRWIWNNAQSLMCRRGAWIYIYIYIFFEVIHQISRSLGLINRRFESNLSKITRPVAAIKSLRFALFLFKPVLYREMYSTFLKRCVQYSRHWVAVGYCLPTLILAKERCPVYVNNFTEIELCSGKIRFNTLCRWIGPLQTVLLFCSY